MELRMQETGKKQHRLVVLKIQPLGSAEPVNLITTYLLFKVFVFSHYKGFGTYT